MNEQNDQDVSRSNDSMAADRASAFVGSLESTRTKPSSGETWARLGMIIMIVGVTVAVVATILSQMSDNPLDQSTQISLGIAGLAATCLGGVVFLRYSLGELLRFWLVRIVHEQAANEVPNQGTGE